MNKGNKNKNIKASHKKTLSTLDSLRKYFTVKDNPEKAIKIAGIKKENEKSRRK